MGKVTIKNDITTLYKEKNMNKIVYIFLIAILLPIKTLAQRNEIYNDRIASLQVVAGENWLLPPIIKLHSMSDANYIHISFDDLTHVYHRYTYTIEHCESDWTVSDELFSSDYVEGFAEGNTIDDIEESLNTNILYNHYSLTIPNNYCRLKLSGNYKVTVYDDNADREPMFTACFMVVEPQMGVSLEVTTNTDIDINNSHQQVNMIVNYNGMTINNPRDQIKTVVTQNQRWDNCKINAVPQYIEDANGAFYIRNSDNIENDRTSEYVLVHYTLYCPQKVSGDVYIDGVWTNNRFLPKYKMEYNEEKGCYEAVVMQKQGYYSYQYIMLDERGVSRIMPTEGSFYQTENTYQAYVYYKGQGERYDRLVGYQNVQYK